MKVYVSFHLTPSQAKELSLHAVGKALSGDDNVSPAWAILADAVAEGTREAEARAAERKKREVICVWCGGAYVAHPATGTIRPHRCPHTKECTKYACRECELARGGAQNRFGHAGRTPPKPV